MDSGFVAGTLVHTDKGLVPIQEIQVGDMVLSKDKSGQGELTYSRVVKTMKSDKKFSIMRPFNGVYCTDNHPFWAKYITKKSEPEWLPANRISDEHRVYTLFDYQDKRDNDVAKTIYQKVQSDQLSSVEYEKYLNELLPKRGFNHRGVDTLDALWDDPYRIGGRYLIATDDPNIALFTKGIYWKDEPGQIRMGVVDFSSGEPVEIYTNDTKSFLGTNASWNSDDGLKDIQHKFLDVNNPHHHAEIRKYSDLLYKYMVADWSDDAHSTAYEAYVYNIEVADDHTYFVGYNRMWVHDINNDDKK